MICTGIPPKSTIHVHNTLKFLLLKDGNNCICPGGEYDPTLDGDGTIPSLEDDNLFKRTGIRLVKEQIGLDISQVTQWWRFIELHYTTHTHKTVTIFYLISHWDLVPSPEEFAISYKARKLARLTKERDSKLQSKLLNLKKLRPKPEDSTSQPPTPSITQPIESKEESEMDDNQLLEKWSSECSPINVDSDPIPDEPHLFINSSGRINSKSVRATVVPLGMLLNYDLAQVSKAAFEVSLFAESFNERLQYAYALLIYNSIMNCKKPLLENSGSILSVEKKNPEDEIKIEEIDNSDKKRKREDEEEEDPKKSKLDLNNSLEVDQKIELNTPSTTTVTPDEQTPSEMEQVDHTEPADYPPDTPDPLEPNETPDQEENPDHTESFGSDQPVLSDNPETPTEPVGEQVISELQRAFWYFDVCQAGYLREVDLSKLIHCLGFQLSKNQVDNIIRKAWGTLQPRLNYHHLIQENLS
jgi:hypothetical protein